MAVKRNSSKAARVGAGEASLGRMLLISLGLHLAALLVIYIGPLQSHSRREILPVYHVDLVNLPVANPQAGRPDARPQPPKPAPKVAEAPPPPPPPAKETVRLPEPAKPTPPKPDPPPVAKAEPKPIAPPKPEPVKPTPKTSAREEAAAQARIEQMRAQQERDALKRRLDELAKGDPRAAAPVADAPLGEQWGKGTDAGPAHISWLGEILKEYWNFSPYLSDRLDLEIHLKLLFDTNGKMWDYRVLKRSGNEQFDESVTKAIHKFRSERFLPNPPKQGSEFDINFNLKDLKR